MLRLRMSFVSRSSFFAQHRWPSRVSIHARLIHLGKAGGEARRCYFSPHQPAYGSSPYTSSSLAVPT